MAGSLTRPDDTAQVIAQAYRHILGRLDPDPHRDGLVDTPDRVARALLEMTQGYGDDPAVILGTCFDVACDEMVVVRDIALVSLCEHHVLPFTGLAHVAYVPRDRVVGLSKIPRLVESFSRRLQIQERLTAQIAGAMVDVLQPRAVGVVIEAQHHCMSCRGVRQAQARMVTCALRGSMRTDPQARAEFLGTIRSPRLV